MIFWVLAWCVADAHWSGFTGRITTWTWVAGGLLLLESAVLAAFRSTCPLTILAERQGAARGSVTDIFLPEWLAERIFPIFGSGFGVALLLILWRLVQ
jgi:hypothetical protein